MAAICYGFDRIFEGAAVALLFEIDSSLCHRGKCRTVPIESRGAKPAGYVVERTSAPDSRNADAASLADGIRLHSGSQNRRVGDAGKRPLKVGAQPDVNTPQPVIVLPTVIQTAIHSLK